MVSTQALTFAYPNGKQFAFPDLRCAPGHTLLVAGRSGCGKSTLLHLLAGILRPLSGQIRIGDTEISQLSPAACDRFRGSHIGLVYQRPHFIAALSILDNLLLPAYFGQKKISRQEAFALAEHLQIAHTLHQLPERLSVGEQQRAGIARALLSRPDLILADEPTSALDDDNCHAVFQLLQAQAAERQAALMIVTHDNRLLQGGFPCLQLDPTNLP